ncbi:MAG: hypothetical protein QM504_03380 [Pseudomonadota bacterium]
MKYILVVLLLLTPIQPKAQDDAILVVAAQIVNRIVSLIKTQGEKLIALLKNKGAKALIRAKKESAKTISLALEGSEAEIHKIINERNLGSGKLLYHVYQNASNQRVVGRFHVSAIAPSACISQTKSNNFKYLLLNLVEINKKSGDLKGNNYSLTSAAPSSAERADVIKFINNKASTGDVDKVPLFPEPNVVIDSNDDNIDIATAKAIKFAYRRAPVNISKMRNSEIDNVVVSMYGQDWLSHYYMAEGLYKTVFNSTTNNFTVINNSKTTTVALEREKSYYYASSNKRMLANQVKYEAGSIMELNYLGNTLLNAKLDEHDGLMQERRLLLIMAIKRLRDLRKGIR